MADFSSPAGVPAPRGRWLALAPFLALEMVITMFAFSVGVMLPDIRADLGISAVQAGWLGAAFFFSHAFLSLPYALLFGRASPRRALTVMGLSSGALIIAQGLASTFLPLVALRYLSTAAIVGRRATLALLLFQWFPVHALVQVNSLVTALHALGQVLAMAATPALLATLGGWRPVLFLLGSLMLAATVAWVALGRDRVTPEYVARFRAQRGAPLGVVLRHSWIWTMAGCQVGSALAWAAFVTFWPTFALENRHLSLASVGLLMGLFPLGSLTGSLAAGPLSGWLGRRKPLVWASGFGMALSYTGLVLVAAPPALAALLFITGFFSFLVIPPLQALPYEKDRLTPQEITVAISLMSTLTPLGAAAGPLLAGAIAQASGSLFAGLVAAIPGCLTLALGGLLLPETGDVAARTQPRPAGTAH